MNVLTNKKYAQFDYISRYTGIPYYFNTVDEREVYGLSKNAIKDAPYVLYQTQQGDTLDNLALINYNNPSYWWVLAYYNDIQDAFVDIHSTYPTLKIPTISAISYGDLR